MLSFQKALELVKPEVAIQIYEQVAESDLEGVPFEQLLSVYQAAAENATIEPIVYKALAEKAQSYKDWVKIWELATHGNQSETESFLRMAELALASRDSTTLRDTYFHLDNYLRPAAGYSPPPFKKGALSSLERKILEQLETGARQGYMYWKYMLDKSPRGSRLEALSEKKMVQYARTLAAQLSALYELDVESPMIPELVKKLKATAISFSDWYDILHRTLCKGPSTQDLAALKDEATDKCLGLAQTFKHWRSMLSVAQSQEEKERYMRNMVATAKGGDARLIQIELTRHPELKQFVDNLNAVKA